MSPVPRKTLECPPVIAARVGERFGKLEVIEHVEANGEGQWLVRVKCDCGARTTVEARRLRGKAGICNGVQDCGGHSDRAERDERLHHRNSRHRREGSTWGLDRPGVEYGGRGKDSGWPVYYIVVAGGQRSEHDNFEEAAEEYRVRRLGRVQ